MDARKQCVVICDHDGQIRCLYSVALVTEAQIEALQANHGGPVSNVIVTINELLSSAKRYDHLDIVTGILDREHVSASHLLVVINRYMFLEPTSHVVALVHIPSGVHTDDKYTAVRIPTYRTYVRDIETGMITTQEVFVKGTSLQPNDFWALSNNHPDDVVYYNSPVDALKAIGADVFGIDLVVNLEGDHIVVKGWMHKKST